MRRRWGALDWAVLVCAGLGATLAATPAMAWDRPGGTRPGDNAPRGWHRQPVPYGYRPYHGHRLYGHAPPGYALPQRQAPALRPPPPPGGVPALPPLR